MPEELEAAYHEALQSVIDDIKRATDHNASKFCYGYPTTISLTKVKDSVIGTATVKLHLRSETKVK